MLDSKLALAAMMAVSNLLAQPSSPSTIRAMIREEGLQHSQVMTYATQLMDGIGPRLTGLPNLDKAINWAEKVLKSACCLNVRTESWGRFGMSCKIWEQPACFPMTQSTKRGNTRAIPCSVTW